MTSFESRRKFRRVLGAAVVATAVMPALVEAAPQTTAEIANYTGADRQAILETGAAKEGVFQLYTTGTQTQPVLEAFGKRYPAVRVEVYRGDSSQVTRKVLEEYKASRFTVDIISLSTGGLHTMREAGHLQPYKSPEAAKYKKDSLGPDGHWVLDYESYLSLGYNTRIVSEADAPKSLDDLLDPKWKGKMAVPGSTTLGNWVGGMVLDKGEAFVRKLGSQQIKVFEVTGRAVANLVVSGEIPLSPATFNSHMANSKETGASVAWRALDGVYSTIDGIALAKNAPHPHAAMLYADFALSTEGQKMLQKLGYASGRTDLENAEKPTKIHYLTERPNYIQEYEKWQALGRQVFGKGENLPGK